MEGLDQERVSDGQRDALAFLGAVIREDYEGIETVLQHCEGYMLVSALASMLFAALQDRQVDPADWVANEQAMMHRAPG